jgi:hypothetical protein
MPPLLPGTQIRTHAELDALWQRLMGRGGFGSSTLWLLFFDAEARVQSVLVPIEGIPAEPDTVFVRHLAEILGDLVDGTHVASVAILLSRPGPRAMTAADRRWARALRAGLGEYTTWPLHLATRDHVRVFAPDDLIGASG